MTKYQLEWQEIVTLHREVRGAPPQEELRWLVNQESISNKNTGEVFKRSFIRHPGICVIVPFISAKEVILLRQYRYAIKDELWELPAGTLHGKEENQRVVATESPELCAERELLEESGYVAGRLEKIAECFAIPGSGDELMHFYFAFNLMQREQRLDVGEMISEVRSFSLSEIKSMIGQGEIRDAKTLIGLFYALQRTASD